MNDEAIRFEDAYDYHEHAACLECWRLVKGDPTWKPQVQHRMSVSMCCWCGADTDVVHVYRSPDGPCKEG